MRTRLPRPLYAALVGLLFCLLTGCASESLTATGTGTPGQTAPLGTPTATPTNAPTASPSACATPATAFLTTSGTQFVYQGQPVRLHGGTIYPDFQTDGRTVRGAAWSLSQFTTYIDSILNQAAQAKFNMIRATDFLSGATDWRDPNVWANMDYLLCQAHARNMFVIISLSPLRNMYQNAGVFPYDPTQWTDYLNFVGQRYRDNPAIAYYAIAGEPAAPNGTVALRPTADQLVNFYRQTAATLYAADGGHHLISSGGLSYLNFNSGIRWQDIFTLPHISFAAIHVYSDNDRNITMPMVSAWAKQQNIPFVIEEYGFKQGMGDSARAGAMTALYTNALQEGAACVGVWNLGPELNDNGYDINPQTPAAWKVLQQFAP